MLQNDVMYVPRAMFARVWVPLTSLGASARATAVEMLKFLEQLHTGRTMGLASARAASVIVKQFKYDLVEMGVVRSKTHFKGVSGDSCIADAMTAEQYVDRVFVTERLPATMSTKSFLSIAFDLLNPRDLKKSLATALLRQAEVVPRTSVHARLIIFSTSVYTLLTRQELSAGVSVDDALKLVMAASPLLKDHFCFTVVERKEIEKVRPRLTRCVRTALSKVRRRNRHPKHLIPVACVVSVLVAEGEGLITARPDYRRIYRAANLSRCIGLKQLRKVVAEAASGRLAVRQCRLVLDRVIAPGRLRRRPPRVG